MGGTGRTEEDGVKAGGGGQGEGEGEVNVGNLAPTVISKIRRL